MRECFVCYGTGLEDAYDFDEKGRILNEDNPRKVPCYYCESTGEIEDGCHCGARCVCECGCYAYDSLDECNCWD